MSPQDTEYRPIFGQGSLTLNKRWERPYHTPPDDGGRDWCSYRNTNLLVHPATSQQRGKHDDQQVSTPLSLVCTAIRPTLMKTPSKSIVVPNM